jgi:hypothetical protein
MALDDLPLGPPRGRPPHDASRSAPPGPLRWIAVGAGGLVAGALLTFWWMSRAQTPPATPAPTVATDVAVTSNRPKRQPIDLPALDDSDSKIAELVSMLSRHPTLARLLATPGLVRATTLAVVQIGEGRTPADPLKALRPSSRLQIRGSASGPVDPKSYGRWDTATAALLSVPPADAAQLYVNVKPLFDQAYMELGHPGGDFDTAIVAAIKTLNETPRISTEPTVERRTGYYEYGDEALRALAPVQKQFLLVGPDNRGRILGWFEQFAAALELKTR